MNLTHLLPYTQHMQAELVAAAAADDHRVVAPTHVVEKEGQLIGYASINGMPVLHWWLSRQHAVARDTLLLQAQMNAIMLDRGNPYYVAACGKDSPYVPMLPKMGYEKWMDTGLYIHDIHGVTSGKLHLEKDRIKKERLAS